jgi:hypothetical protein
MLKSHPLCGVFRPGVQEKNYLVLGKKVFRHLRPVIGRVIAEMIFLRHLREPPVSLMYEADVGEVVLSCIKGDDLKSRGFASWLLRPGPGKNKC